MPPWEAISQWAPPPLPRTQTTSAGYPQYKGAAAQCRGFLGSLSSPCYQRERPTAPRRKPQRSFLHLQSCSRCHYPKKAAAMVKSQREKSRRALPHQNQSQCYCCGCTSTEICSRPRYKAIIEDVGGFGTRPSSCVLFIYKACFFFLFFFFNPN